MSLVPATREREKPGRRGTPAGPAYRSAKAGDN